MEHIFNEEIRIEVSNKCNMHCIMCPRDGLSRELGIMSFADFKRIIDEAHEYGFTRLNLTGYGETFYSVDKVLRFIDYAKKYDFHLYVITNGLNLSEKVAQELVDAQFEEIRFSVCGVSREVYNHVHGVNAYDIAYRNIERLLDLRKGKEFPKVYVSSVYLDENKHELGAWIKYWENKADIIEWWKPHNYMGARNYRQLQEDRKTCGRPKRGPLQVLWDGRISACCFDYNGELILGDLKRQSIREYYQSQELLDMIEAHENGEFWKYPACDRCDHLNVNKDGILVYTNDKRYPVEERVNMLNTNIGKRIRD